MAYVTRQDYFKARGIDLEIELKGSISDDPAKNAEIFIEETEELVIEYLESKYDFNRSMIAKTSLTEAEFKKAIIYQIDYVRRNGKISNDSERVGKVLSPNAYNVLFNIGFCNLPTGMRYIYHGN